jgi:hypothetical protein
MAMCAALRVPFGCGSPASDCQACYEGIVIAFPPQQVLIPLPIGPGTKTALVAAANRQLDATGAYNARTAISALTALRVASASSDPQSLWIRPDRAST